MSERKYWLVTLALLLIVIINFCNPPAGSTDKPKETAPVALATPAADFPTAKPDVLGSAEGGSAGFLAGLRAKGLKVETAGQVRQPFLPIPGDLVICNGANVQVFEFGDQAAQKEAAARISKGGAQITFSTGDWFGQPSFWAGGRIIVLYLGKDRAVIDPITAILGKPITLPAVAE